MDTSDRIASLARTVLAVRKLFWHGSGIQNLRGILKQGLLPAGTKKVFEDASGRGDYSRSLKTFGGVYLTDSWMTAEGAASTGSVDKSRHTIVGVTLESRSPSAMPDEDDIMPLVEYALQMTRLSDLLQSFWGPSLRDFYRTFGTIQLPPSVWPDVVNVIEKEDLSEARERLMKRLLRAWPRLERRYDIPRQKKILDELMDGVLRAFTYHLIEVGSEPKVEEAVQGYKKIIEEAKYEDWVEDAEKSLRILKRPPPQLKRAFGGMRDAVDLLSRALHETTDPREGAFRNNLRLMDPITYRGKNRIVLVAEMNEREESGNGKNYTTVTLHYDKSNPARNEFIAEYDRAMGGSWRMISRNEKLLYHKLASYASEWPVDIWGPEP